jgi:hypothetical protein
MTRLLLVATLAISLILALAWYGSAARAQAAPTCILSLATAEKNVKDSGGQWFGEFGESPALGSEDNRFVYYARKDGTIMVSIVYPGDCMWTGADLPVGNLKDKGTPA